MILSPSRHMAPETENENDPDDPAHSHPRGTKHVSQTHARTNSVCANGWMVSSTRRLAVLEVWYTKPPGGAIA